MTGLFKPAWMSKNEKKALKAVEKETDQNELGNIANNAPIYKIRNIAAEKLSDENSILFVAIYTSDDDIFEMLSKKLSQSDMVRIAATTPYFKRSETIINTITNQSEIAQIARGAMHSGVRILAIKKLTDQPMLMDIVENEKDYKVRREAVKKLADQNFLAKIAMEDNLVEIEAVGALTDADILREFEKGKGGPNISTMARIKLTSDQSILYEIAQNSNNYALRAAAVTKLIDKTKLENIKMSCGNEMIRAAVEERLAELTG